jgi:hypothetical protein
MNMGLFLSDLGALAARAVPDWRWPDVAPGIRPFFDMIATDLGHYFAPILNRALLNLFERRFARG